MTRDVVIAPPWLSLADAWKVLSREKIRHLPVVERGELVGIVSDRDLLLAASGTAAHPSFPAETVAEAMTTHPVTCAPETSIAEAASLMIDKKIDALPVVTGGSHLVGLVTSTDLLMLLLEREPLRALPFDFHLSEAAFAA